MIWVQCVLPLDGQKWFTDLNILFYLKLTIGGIIFAEFKVLITLLHLCPMYLLQDTLAEATALLTELEAQENSDMDTSHSASEDSQPQQDSQETEKYPSVDFSIGSTQPLEGSESYDDVDERLWCSLPPCIGIIS